MKKFYAVTAGCYSDYHIVTITDNKENAERIAAAYGADVEEYEDNIVDPVGVWDVSYFMYKDGHKYWQATSVDPDLHDDDDDEFKEPSLFGAKSFNHGGYKSWTIFVKAKDKDHAIKSAQDKYAQWKAEQEGIV